MRKGGGNMDMSGHSKMSGKGGQGPKVDAAASSKASLSSVSNFGKGGNANVKGSRLGSRKGSKR